MLDDTTRVAEARALRTGAMAHVAARLGPFERPPRVIFCATDACGRRFADPRVAGLNFGIWGSVITPRG